MAMLLRPPIPSAANPHWRWNSLHGSARALALSEAVRTEARPWAFVAADTRELERMAGELRFFGGESLEILLLPDWEVLPYDVFSPHPDIVSERLRTLSRLPELQRGILLLTADSLLSRLPPRSYVGSRSFDLTRGATLAIEPLRLRLAESGYASVSQVTGPGEFALRGSLFDVWPMGTATPLRVDLLDEQIESIRRFDPESQRSLEATAALRMLPARELPLDAEAVRGFRRRFRTRFEGDVTRMPVYRGVSEGLAPPGIEFYLPLFFDDTASLADYLPASMVFASDIDIDAAMLRAWQGIQDRYDDRRHDIERPLLPPAEAFMPPEAIQSRLALHPSVSIERFRTVVAAESDRLDSSDSAAALTLPPLQQRIRAPQPMTLQHAWRRPSCSMRVPASRWRR